MKYSHSEYMEIGRKVCSGELSRKDAVEQYQVSETTIGRCIRDYKISVGINQKIRVQNSDGYTRAYVPKNSHKTSSLKSDPNIEQYMNMSKEELINELIRAKVNEARAKKGYEVKGDGANKEYVILNSKNSK